MSRGDRETDQYARGYELRSAQEAREQQQRDERARRRLVAGTARRAAEAGRERELAEIEAEERARRDLEQHARDLAVEVKRARARCGPNPWLGPADPGYVSPTEWRIRQSLRQRAQQRPVEDSVDRALEGSWRALRAKSGVRRRTAGR